MPDLLFEIGTEEIPAGFIPPALRQLEEDLTNALKGARLPHGEVRAVGTPRRLAVWAKGVGARQPDGKVEALGPPVSAAFDAEGKPTQAALGFAKSQGVPVEKLGRAATPKGERLAATRVEKGQKADAVLPEILEKILAGIRFRKVMRWGDGDATFARPVRWLVALFDGRPLPVTFAGLKAGAVTHGHRFLAKKPIRLTGKPDAYLSALRQAKVIADPAERRAAIEKQLAVAAKKEGGKIREDAALLDQVTFLVEHPTAIAGSFEESNLALPAEVVISEMRNHQRYFALVDEKGTLENGFVAVSGTPVKNPKVARHGYERVLRARLADARFFYDEDQKRKLADRVEDLRRRTYQAKLGSEHDRVQRLRAIAKALLGPLGLEARAAQVDRAALLAKADLGTGMVGEFPELQGIMGRCYAALQGEPQEIAEAIEDHYRPLGASEEMPRSDLGAVVALADRLHTLCGILGVGEKVTGAADPFGLRRAAIGIIRIVLDRRYHLPLGIAVGAALTALEGKLAQPRDAVRVQVLEFLRGRLRATFEGHHPDLIEAVLAAGFDDIQDARERLEALSEIKARPDFLPLAVAFKRVANIQEKADSGAGAVALDPSLFREDAERALADKTEEVARRASEARKRRDHRQVLREVAEVKPAVDRFFDDVMVMTDEEALRNNRLALMKRVGNLFADIADFRKIQAEN
jgi:glycyl-tRNA synthetase beta chain